MPKPNPIALPAYAGLSGYAFVSVIRKRTTQNRECNYNERDIKAILCEQEGPRV